MEKSSVSKLPQSLQVRGSNLTVIILILLKF